MLVAGPAWGLCWTTAGVQVDDSTRLQRLTYRHQQHGMSHDEADNWARTTDQDNAVLIAQSLPRADLVITLAVSDS